MSTIIFNCSSSSSSDFDRWFHQFFLFLAFVIKLSFFVLSVWIILRSFLSYAEQIILYQLLSIVIIFQSHFIKKFHVKNFHCNWRERFSQNKHVDFFFYYRSQFFQFIKQRDHYYRFQNSRFLIKRSSIQSEFIVKKHSYCRDYRYYSASIV